MHVPLGFGPYLRFHGAGSSRSELRVDGEDVEWGAGRVRGAGLRRGDAGRECSACNAPCVSPDISAAVVYTHVVVRCAGHGYSCVHTRGYLGTAMYVYTRLSKYTHSEPFRGGVNIPKKSILNIYPDSPSPIRTAKAYVKYMFSGLRILSQVPAVPAPASTQVLISGI